MDKPHIGLSLTSYKAIARIYNTNYGEKIAEKIVHHTYREGLDSCSFDFTQDRFRRNEDIKREHP